MEILVEADNIHLIYKESRNDGPWEDKDVEIKLQKTPCRYGGFQYWFECPVCRHRSLLSVYLSDTWCCRHCGHLAYPSENEDELERLRSKALKLKRKAGKRILDQAKGNASENLRSFERDSFGGRSEKPTKPLMKK